MSHPPSRCVRPFQWQNLALAGIAATVAVGHAAHADAADAPDQGAKIWLAQSEGGEGGEGGEGVGVGEVDATMSNLAARDIIAGHLTSGITLYRDGQGDMAITHMKHPGDEIYTSLAPKLDARDAPGFADELEALATSVESGGPVEEANAAFEAVLAKLAEAGAVAEMDDAREPFEVMESVVRTAAEDYEIGVTGGAMTNLHEYQDAWGFMQATTTRAEALAASGDAEVREAAETVLKILAETDAAFKGLTPSETVEGASEILYAAAARIELASLSVKS